MTVKLPFQIEIPRRSNACAIGNELFAHGANYYSLIIDNEGILLRRDYCEACWEHAKKNPELASKTFWKSRVVGKKLEEDKLKNRDERALEILKAALVLPDDESAAEAFIMALYLTRRKILAFRQQIQREDGVSINLYEVVATEEMLAVKTVALSNLKAESLQKRIADKLK